jgi:hypothetical protein
MLPRINRELLQQSLYRFPQILQIFDKLFAHPLHTHKTQKLQNKNPATTKASWPRTQIVYSCTTCKSVMQNPDANK